MAHLTYKAAFLPVLFIAMASALHADPITDALAGKSLVNDTADIKLARNGALSGMVGANKDVELKGAWTIREGRWCRTLSKPESAAGTACQDITLNGDGTVTIDGTNGLVTYTIK